MEQRQADAPAPGPVIRAMAEDDWPHVSRIYAEGIATGLATLEAGVPDWPAWDTSHHQDGRLVAEVDGEVVGFVALSHYSRRSVYRGVVWESVYVAATHRGRGIGTALLDAVVQAAEAAGLWTLLAGVMAENEASLALHLRAGFRILGVHEHLGQDRDGRWRDVVLLERRSRG